MRINGTVVATQPTVDEAERTKVLRRRPVERRSEAFEPLTSDVPLSQAGTVRASDQGQVTGRLGVRQGSTNACGPVALWLALGQFGRATQDWRQLDDELRPWSLGTSPGTLLEGARSRGLRAQLYNHGSFFDLERETQAGRAVLVLTDVRASTRAGGPVQAGDQGDLGSHWMRVTQSWEDSLGRRWVEYENPWGTRELQRYEQFEQVWGAVRLAGVPTGYDRTYLLLDRTTSKPLPTTTADDVLAITTAADGAQTFARGIDALARGKALTGVGRLVSGAIACLLGGVGSLLAVPGGALARSGSRQFVSGKQSVTTGGLPAVGGVFELAGGAATTALGLALSSMGNAVGFAGQLLATLLREATSAVARLAR